MLDEGSEDVKTQLQRLAHSVHSRETTAAVGSKLVLDPHVYLSSESIQTLTSKINPDVRLLGVTRSYLDIFLSFYARGVLHARGTRDIEHGKEDTELARAAAGYSSEQWQTRQICLTELDRLAVAPNPPPPPEPGCRFMSIADACDLLLVLFYNDALIARQLWAGASPPAAVQYENIGRDLAGITRTLGINADPQLLQDALNDPYLIKLPELTADLITPSAIVAELSVVLDNARQRLFLGRDPIIAPAESGQLRITDESLARFFLRTFDGARNQDLFSIEGGALIWRCRAPVV